MQTKPIDNRSLIVILGAGRTGTSLLTRILIELGMSGSAENIASSGQNPGGFFEDSSIVRCHLEILSLLGAHTYLPLPENFLDTAGINQYITRLCDIVEKNTAAAETVWGFKDPRTPSLLPLWLRVFNRTKTVPSYILAVRDPASAVTSMHKQYNDPRELAELVWLQRTCDALYHTGGNCFIVHYEDWFSSNAAAIGEQLLSYTGLDRFRNPDDRVVDRIGSVVKPNLNRAVFGDYTVQNRYVHRLYDALLQSHGDHFNRQALMETAMECRRAMREFSGWSNLAQTFFKQKEQARKNAESNDLLVRCKDLTDENDQLRIKISVQQRETRKVKQELEREKKQTAHLQRKCFLLESSTSFQIGQHMINALAKPGKKTVFLPLYILRTLLASRAVKQ